VACTWPPTPRSTRTEMEQRFSVDCAVNPRGKKRELAADTALFDTLVATVPDTEVHTAGDRSGLGLIRKAIVEGARVACAI
jgi:hypothetical protein